MPDPTRHESNRTAAERERDTFERALKDIVRAKLATAERLREPSHEGQWPNAVRAMADALTWSIGFEGGDPARHAESVLIFLRDRPALRSMIVAALSFEVVPVQRQPERGAEDTEAIRLLHRVVEEPGMLHLLDDARAFLARLDTKGERDADS